MAKQERVNCEDNILHLNKWDSIGIASIIITILVCLTILTYNASPDKLCFVELEGNIEGIFDLNVSKLEPFTRLTINNAGGKASIWLPCNRLGG